MADNRTNLRESNFELLRLYAIFSVLMYHGISWYIMNYAPENMVGHALWLPFRTAVTLFVLISGYFGIKESVMGGAKLIGKTLFYFVPIEVASTIIRGGGLRDLIHAFMPISNGPYWFISTYLCLFLLSPAINQLLNEISIQKRRYLIIVLAFMSLYLGFFGPTDGPLALGKNVIHFILIYIIGYTIRKNEDRVNGFPIWILWALFILLNIGPVIFFVLFSETKLTYLMCLFDWDNGVFLLINAIVTFLLVSKWHFKSKFINYLASSVFAIYILQQEPFISSALREWFYGIWPFQINPGGGVVETLNLAFFVFIRSILFMIIFIAIDKLLTPIWNSLNELYKRIDASLMTYRYR